MSRLATFVGNATGGSSYTQPQVNEMGQVSGTVQLDLANYDGFELELIGATTINFTGLSTNNRREAWISLKNGGVSNQDVTFDSRAIFDVNSDGLWTNETVSNPWDITLTNFTGNTLDVSNQETSPFGLALKSDGTKLYFSGSSSDTIHQYSLNVAWDLSTATLDAESFDVSGYVGSQMGLAFGDSGNYLYLIGRIGNSRMLYQFALSTPWDITTATELASIAVPTSVDPPQGIFVNNDGTKFFIVRSDLSENRVYGFTMSTPWDITTLTGTASLNVATEEPNPRSVFFSSDGTMLFLVGNSSDTVFMYNLSSPWDVSTATYSNTSFVVSSEITGCSGITFGANGSKMYVMGFGNDAIAEYDIGIISNSNLELISVNQFNTDTLLLSNVHLQVNE